MDAFISVERDKCYEWVRGNKEVVVFIAGLCGVIVVTTSREAMLLVFHGGEWNEATLAQIYKFIFQTFTKQDIIDYLRKIMPGVNIQDG